MSDMSEIIKESLDGINSFADPQKVVGDAIHTPSGVTIIPISKLTVGFAGGGADYGQKKLTHTQTKMLKKQQSVLFGSSLLY